MLGALSDDLYRLALRMVWHPEDAADATQEILVKVMTRLSTWRGEASVRTWAWRVAVRHLLDRRRSRVEEADWSFDAFADDLAHGLGDAGPAGAPDAELLADEVRLGCTLGMLQCLDRDHRVAYILGEVFGLCPSLRGRRHGRRGRRPTASACPGPRSALRRFVAAHCGIVDPANACRCARRRRPGRRARPCRSAAPRVRRSPGGAENRDDRHAAAARRRPR